MVWRVHGGLGPGLIVQAATLRPYSLCVLAEFICLASLLRYLDSGRARWLLAFSLSLTFAVLLLYSSFLVALALGLVFVGALFARTLTRNQIVGLMAAASPAAISMLVLFLTHIRPQILGSAMLHDATDQWLRQQFAQDLLQASQLIYGAADHAYSATLHGWRWYLRAWRWSWPCGRGADFSAS